MAVQSQQSLKIWVCPQNYAMLKKINTRSKKKSSQILLREVFKFNFETSLRRIWPESQYCSRICFFEHRIILMTNKKFQTPLTLNSHKSGLKNHRIKNYHIFGTSRTSVFIWHPRIPHENFCIGVICKNAKKYRFFPFSVSRRWKKVRGRRSDNFEATGRAHSSFGSFLPIFFGEHIEIGITSETVGPRPPWSEMIQICVLQKALF